MATTRLPKDFKEFFELLGSERVEYLLVGGFAVGHYGYPRATGDMDVWVGTNPPNADALARALVRFGFSPGSVDPASFAAPNRVIQMGVPPLRIDVLTSVSGLDFAAAYEKRELVEMDGVSVSVISLDDLKTNKSSAGRPKDQVDLEHL